MFTGALKASGRYDDALIIFTSDHAWPQDPDWEAGRLTEPRTHVPLIVKLPGQTRPLTIESRFVTSSLGALIRVVLESGADLEAVQCFVASAAKDEPRGAGQSLAQR
jgi:hypothetical protein